MQESNQPKDARYVESIRSNSRLFLYMEVGATRHIAVLHYG
jgi:hypothetical protein